MDRTRPALGAHIPLTVRPLPAIAQLERRQVRTTNEAVPLEDVDVRKRQPSPHEVDG